MSDDQQGTPRPDDETQPVRREGAEAPLPEPPGTTPATATTATTATAATAATAAQPQEPAPVVRRGFRERFRTLRRTDGRDRSYGLAALIASALAGVIVGGLGLATFHAITHDGPGDRFDRGGWVQRREDRGGPGFGGPGGGMRGGPPGMPGQVQPTTPPEEDEGSNS